MADGQVFVIDRVVTAPGCARRFVDSYLAEYAPGAQERGMTLRDVLVSPPVWFDDNVNTVTITWTLPSVRAWWEMTWQGRSDPSLAEWWSRISDIVVERTRSFAADAHDVDDLCDV
ncbi:hypothetical protein BST27_00350 [Mycobacterium intermedium]|uniref:Superfamily II DNA helicase n=1 Tax=Mycobacterium intermedium TaxID=28445 RepID=A0A1E3SF30_MYCIE|nr:hypothetical protein [Mycobacterium intermedium]MCV6966713.1 hypothetical protein [Mycobacterium intermedium]ODR00774.1 hypothetical protein BHQ20_11300 [Mycobacterium intermedium]OPE48449.1 hypothetical protein BV508_18055 [Mycobacterium intermedium]ORB10621.1 hypothetical protein BST27_00350 [Mycobacterium intermedium]